MFENGEIKAGSKSEAHAWKNAEVRQTNLQNLGVYLGVKTSEDFPCFVAIVIVRVYYVDVFVFFILLVRITGFYI